MMAQFSYGSQECIQCCSGHKHTLADEGENESGCIEVQNHGARRHREVLRILPAADESCYLGARSKDSKTNSAIRSTDSQTFQMSAIDLVDCISPSLERGTSGLYRWREAGQALHSYLSQVSTHQTSAVELREPSDNGSGPATSIPCSCWNLSPLVSSHSSIGDTAGSCVYSSSIIEESNSNFAPLSACSAVNSVYKSCDQLEDISRDDDVRVFPDSVHQEGSGFLPFFDELREKLSRLSDDKERRKSGSAVDRRKQRLEEMTKRRFLCNLEDSSSSEDGNLGRCNLKPRKSHHNLHHSVKSEPRSLEWREPSQVPTSKGLGEVTAHFAYRKERHLRFGEIGSKSELSATEISRAKVTRPSQTRYIRSRVCTEAINLVESGLFDPSSADSCDVFSGQFDHGEIDAFCGKVPCSIPYLGKIAAGQTSPTETRRSGVVSEAFKFMESGLFDSSTEDSCDGLPGQFDQSEMDALRDKTSHPESAFTVGRLSQTEDSSRVVAEADSVTAASSDVFPELSNHDEVLERSSCVSESDSLSTSTPDINNSDDVEEYISTGGSFSRTSAAPTDHSSRCSPQIGRPQISRLSRDMLKLQTFLACNTSSESNSTFNFSDDENLLPVNDVSISETLGAASVGSRSDEMPPCHVSYEPHRHAEAAVDDSPMSYNERAIGDTSMGIEHSLWDYYNVEAEADDEFECDCPVCLMNRDQIQDVWRTGDTQDVFNRSTSDDAGLFSFSIEEPSYNVLSHSSLLESLFQDVIVQMLQVYPDLLTGQTPPPLSSEEFNTLKSFQVVLSELGTDIACSICLCQFEEGEDAKCLPCRHSYHMLCIQAWLLKTGTCPVCRDVVMQSTRSK